MSSSAQQIPQSWEAVPNERRDIAFEEQLRSRLVQGRTSSWSALIELADGAHPLAIASVARSAGIALDEHPGSAPAWAEDIPELHQLEEEWYFDETTSAALAEEYLVRSGAVALGCPTAVRAALRLGTSPPLIDRSAALPLRLSRWGVPRAIYADLLRPLDPTLVDRFRVVLLDPPWHLADMLAWLRQAAWLCNRGGVIAFPMFRPLTKPAGAFERDALLDSATRIGRVRIERGAIRYRTPRFEWEAGRADRVPIPPRWRVADMVTIDVKRAQALQLLPAPASLPPREQWRTWVIGTQVVKLRVGSAMAAAGPEAPTSGAAADTDILHLIPGTTDGVLPSVRRRDVRRARAGLWTSRQRLAAVTDPPRVAAWLDALAAPAPGPRQGTELPELLMRLIG